MMIQPMLAKLSDKSLFKEKNLIYEPKLDGTRAICHTNKEIKLINRRGNNITHRYPEFDFKKNIKAKSCVLDGEIVIFNKKGISEFNLLQKRDLLEDKEKIATRSKLIPATYVVFDILKIDGKSLTNISLKERFQTLKKIIKPSKNLKLISQTKSGKKLFDKLTKKGGEGVMAKNIEGKYHTGKRTRDWQKIKKQDTIDAVIIGYTQEKRELSTLLLAVYDSKTLKYIGKVGTGFSEKEQKEILKKLEKIKTNKSAIEDLPKNTIFVKPKLVCEAKYLEITKDKMMRAPVFLRMRTDKTAKDCKFKGQV